MDHNPVYAREHMNHPVDWVTAIGHWAPPCPEHGRGCLPYIVTVVKALSRHTHAGEDALTILDLFDHYDRELEGIKEAAPPCPQHGPGCLAYAREVLTRAPRADEEKVDGSLDPDANDPDDVWSGLPDGDVLRAVYNATGKPGDYYPRETSSVSTDALLRTAAVLHIRQCLRWEEEEKKRDRLMRRRKMVGRRRVKR